MSAKLRPVPAQRRMPVRTQRIELTDEYEGWWIDIRTNVRAGVLHHLEIFEGSEAEIGPSGMRHILDFLFAITVDWNFVDEDGEPIPITREGCDQVALDLVLIVVQEYQKMGMVPKPLSAT